MKNNPKGTALLYIKDLLYVNLHHNQVWGVLKREDGEYEISHGPFTLVLSETEYKKYFTEENNNAET